MSSINTAAGAIISQETLPSGLVPRPRRWPAIRESGRLPPLEMDPFPAGLRGTRRGAALLSRCLRTGSRFRRGGEQKTDPSHRMQVERRRNRPGFAPPQIPPPQLPSLAIERRGHKGLPLRRGNPRGAGARIFADVGLTCPCVNRNT